MKRISITAFDAKRRGLLRALTTTMAALAVARCGGGGGDGSTSTSPAPGAAPAPSPSPAPGANVAPVWVNIPTVQFTRGVASSFSIASFVSDPNGDTLTLTMNAVTLPAGVTFDAAGKRLVYDGIGATASVSGVQMTADDGRP